MDSSLSRYVALSACKQAAKTSRRSAVEAPLSAASSSDRGMDAHGTGSVKGSAWPGLGLKNSFGYRR